MIDAERKLLRLGIGFGAYHEHAHHRLRRRSSQRCAKVAAIGLCHVFAAVGVDKVRKCKGQSQAGSQRATVIGGTKQPDFGRTHARGHGLHAGIWMLLRQGAIEPAEDIHDLLRKAIRVVEGVRIYRIRGHAVGAGGAADAEVDALRIKRFVHPEHFGDLEWTVIWQHDAAGAHANVSRCRRNRCHQNFRTGIGEPTHVVMFRKPVAVEAQLVCPLCQRQRRVQRIGGAACAEDRGLIEDAQSQGHAAMWRCRRRIIASHRIARLVSPSSGSAVRLSVFQPKP